ncbi:hypothetical protein LENED_004396 [Lentinula edodes]|uniref:Uncharacterized protein n=1 Tax=Lentinula edodes TaxID=5353 RepID=A0A1Q3E679_LENED|nr:hypothetical protein LENED_004396 [Lentinula edodes]
MSTSTLMAHPNPSILVVSPDTRKTSVIYLPVSENVVPAPKPSKFDYFDPTGNYHEPEILQERAALERIVHAFSRRRDE